MGLYLIFALKMSFQQYPFTNPKQLIHRHIVLYSHSRQRAWFQTLTPVCPKNTNIKNVSILCEIKQNREFAVIRTDLTLTVPADLQLIGFSTATKPASTLKNTVKRTRTLFRSTRIYKAIINSYIAIPLQAESRQPQGVTH